MAAASAARPSRCRPNSSCAKPTGPRRARRWARSSAARAIHGRFELAGYVDALRDAATAFAAEAATGRELAQMLVAGLHAVEIPARYVSGYRQREGRACAPHGWVEAHAGDGGWIAVDPSTGGRIDERYVRVAVGLDTAGVTPVAGSRLGQGEEMLDVAVTVEQAGSDA